MNINSKQEDECKRALSLLFEYADGALTGDDLLWLERHIDHCPDCRRELDSCRETLKLIKYAKYEPTANIKGAVMSRLADEEQDKTLVSPFVSAFTGFIKSKRYIHIGTIAAAFVVMALVVVNHDLIFRSISGVKGADNAAMAPDMVAFADEAFEEKGSEVLKTQAAFYSAPNETGASSAKGAEIFNESAVDITAETDSPELEIKATPTVGMSDEAKTMETGATAANSTLTENAEEDNKTSDSTTAASAPETMTETMPETMASDSDTNEFDYTIKMTTGEELIPPEINRIDIYAQNSIGTVETDDQDRVIAALGISIIDTIEFDDGNKVYVGVYRLQSESELVDYLMMLNVDFEVSLSGKTIPEDEASFVFITNLK